MISRRGALRALRRGIAQSYARQDRLQLSSARTELEKAAGAGDLEVAAEAHFYLGKVLKDLGEVEAARAAYKAALDSDVPGFGPNAGILLAKMLMDHGDMSGAQSALERTIAYRDQPLQPRPANPLEPVRRDAINWPFHAAVGLEALMERRGDDKGARKAKALSYELSEDDDDVQTELNRGYRFRSFGYDTGARRAFEQVVVADHPRWSPLATGMLEHMDSEQG